MDLIQNVVDTAAGVVFSARDAARQFDLEKENIGGLFSNLTLLSAVLAAVTGDRKPFAKKEFKKEYDYVIVGGGSAGSVMANRLSEIPCIQVLLLEAGGEAPFLTEVPSFARLFYGSNIDWLYKTVPQKYGAFGQKNRQVNWNNGKVLGGSSVLNAMLYARGNMKNFDDWEADGATGWGWKDVFPFFLKLEDNRDIELLEPGYHRRGGPQTAEFSNYRAEIKDPILQAAQALGYETRDINGRRQTGMYEVQGTVRNQQRCSTAKSYLEPARGRNNLDILTNAYARKVLIRKINGVSEAYGVEFDHKGQTYTVRARREVILSTGAIKTPQILILSGIGPKEQLQKLNEEMSPTAQLSGLVTLRSNPEFLFLVNQWEKENGTFHPLSRRQIPVVADLPAGKNLQDHWATNLLYSVKGTIVPVVQKYLNPINILDYTVNRRGPLTEPNQVSVMAFLDGLNSSRYSRDFPRQEIYFCEYDVLDAKANLNLRDEVYNKVYAPYILRPLYICYASNVQPYGRGEITLNSTDPYAMPIIDPRYYEDERDLRDVVEGMKICEAIAQQPAMRQVEARLIETQRTGFPNCEKLEGNQDQYFACIARQVINTFWHYSGTARMGQPRDPRSVVDPQLRVIGVNNLRVVSAAIMPIVISGNTNVPTIMIAEKAYDMMKGDISCEIERQNEGMFLRRKGGRKFCTKKGRQ